ncbi:MAG: hypothetical protein IPP64_09935 [Bacteroidetes bacterium]|nr:hypothetical protein [Bacteroidota bacterium]
MAVLKDYIQRINDIFNKEGSRYTAHEMCKPILLEMAKDQSILFEIIKKNIEKPDFFLQKRINPVIAFEIETNETVSFVAHCWMPLPTKRNDITHQSIHHHGKLLLTSIAAFGPGYESILFKKGYTIDKKSGETHMEIEKVYTNPLYNIEFIDVNTPHVVFYPSQFSITYALWTNQEASNAENLKKYGLVNKYKKQLRKMIDFFGAANLLGLNTNEYLDFYPKNGKIIAMKSRVMYKPGSNGSFTRGFFSLLQTINYTDTNSIKKALKINSKSNTTELEKLANDYFSNVLIEDDFEKIHLNVEKVNFEKSELKKAFSSII